MSTMKRPAWFKEFLNRYRRDVVRAIALGLVTIACAALLMFTSGYLISKTAVAATTLFSIMIPVACVQLFGFGRPVARYLERLASHDWVLHITSDMRLMLFNAIENRIGDPARERATGEYLGLLADDVAHLQNLYLRVVFPSAIAYGAAIAASILFGFFSLPFMLIMLCALFAVTVVLPFATMVATRALIVRSRSMRAVEYAKVVDDLYGATDWMLADRGAEALARHAADDRSARQLESKRRLAERVASTALAILLGALLCSIVVWAGTAFGNPGADANYIAAFALGFFPLIESFVLLPAAFSESTAHDDSIKRLDEYLGEKHGERVSTLSYNAIENAYALSLDSVQYTYPHAHRRALDGVICAFNRGESCAILGRSGAGKSTLANVLRGVLRPDQGTVTVLGKEVDETSADLSSLISFIDQTPYLFNRTLRDNLAFGAPHASDDDYREALQRVGLAGKLATLDAGLDTIVGETGVGFSGGEAHRIALARALVAQTPIVIVDEPFSALDPETERELLDTIIDVFEDRTLIVITHHLAQIERFDRVLFVENGRIDLDGAPHDLMRTSERFRDLIAFDR